MGMLMALAPGADCKDAADSDAGALLAPSSSALSDPPPLPPPPPPPPPPPWLSRLGSGVGPGSGPFCLPLR